MENLRPVRVCDSPASLDSHFNRMPKSSMRKRAEKLLALTNPAAQIDPNRRGRKNAILRQFEK
jgi:hypothetical protein